MNNFDKKHYKELKKYAKKDGIKLFCVEYDDYTGNGVTIAYQPMTSGMNNRMVAVSVSYCSPEDEFIKKIGKYQAILKFMNREFVQLPLGFSLNLLSQEDFEEILVEMFTPTT